MPLDRVLESIDKNTQKDVSRIIEYAKAEAKGIIKRAEGRAEKRASAREDSTRQRVEKLRRKKLSLAELTLRKERLVTQREALRLVYEEMAKSLASMPAKRNRELLLKVVERAKKEFVSPVVYSNARDAASIKAMTGVEFGGEIDCIGGITAEEKGGKLRLNFTYESLLEDVWKECQKDVADILFGD